VIQFCPYQVSAATLRKLHKVIMSPSIKSNYGVPLESIASSSTYAVTESSSITKTVSQDSSSSTIAGALLNYNQLFNPTTCLQIRAHGKPVLSFPLPSNELEIPIFSTETGRPVYISIRPTRRKGLCRLVLAEDSFETAIARTTYRFGPGPGRNPVVRIGRDDDLSADEFEMVGKNLLTRTVGFETRKWGRFEWRYGNKEERRKYRADNLLVLEKIMGNGEYRIRVAQLVRNDDSRTPGTKRAAAGNGGRLQMNLRGEAEEELLDEVVVVATCLVMLKKEIDRLRAIQIMAISGAAGGW
jgi:hypothetical protein